MYAEVVVLQYQAADNMEMWVQDVPGDIFDNPNAYTVSLAMRQTPTTPYGQVDRLTYEIRDTTRQFVVHAWGGGFVQGHLLRVSLEITKRL